MKNKRYSFLAEYTGPDALMNDWADTLRELGNDSAHPKPGQLATSPRDASDVTQFLDFLLEYLYSLPHQIQQYRARSQDQ